MNRFLIAALLLLLVALSMVVGAFLYVQFLLVADTPTTRKDVVEVVPGDAAAEEAAESEGEVNLSVEAAPATPSAIIDTSIPLSSLPLSAAQKSLLSKAGIDYETFIITPEMIGCAQGKLGVERFNAIVDGSSLSALESMSLLGCL